MVGYGDGGGGVCFVDGDVCTEGYMVGRDVVYRLSLIYRTHGCNAILTMPPIYNIPIVLDSCSVI